MSARATALCFLIAVAGCGDDDSPSNADMATTGDLAVRDLASSPDLARAQDLSSPPDLSELPDLATPPDLARPADLLLPPPEDDGGNPPPPPPPCGPSEGYAGIGGECGLGGECNGHKYALDCDKVACICSFDRVPIHGYAQMPASCMNLMIDWKVECGF